MNINLFNDLRRHDGQRESNLNKLQNSIRQYFVFSEEKLKHVEINIDEIIRKARNGQLKECTIDHTPLRKKYFFGERYTYGPQTAANGLGSEKLFPKGSVDPIPSWINHYLINPLIEARILPKNFVNSVVINDYKPGGCIVSHIDPPQIFDRPIVSLSLFSDSALCFGCRFKYKPLRCSAPLLKLEMPRGVVTSLSGFAANEITHCVRPEDITQRRAVIMLRRVHYCAPRLSFHHMNNFPARIVNKTYPLGLSAESFMKIHQAMVKWQNEGKCIGRISKKTRRNESFSRYTAEHYKII